MIFYFSGTGNTRWVAQFLQQELNDTLRFIPDEIGGEMHYKLKEGERLGFVFPCYGWGVPPFVERFIEQVRIEHVEYLYFVTTCGDDTGMTAEIFCDDVAKKAYFASDEGALAHLRVLTDNAGAADVGGVEDFCGLCDPDIFTDFIKPCRRQIISSFQNVFTDLRQYFKRVLNFCKKLHRYGMLCVQKLLCLDRSDPAVSFPEEDSGAASGAAEKAGSASVCLYLRLEQRPAF